MLSAPGVGVGARRRVHAVGEPAAFADLVEEPAGRAATERVVEDVECLAPRIGAGQGPKAHRQVRLLGVVLAAMRDRLGGRGRCAHRRPAAGGDTGERMADGVEHRVVTVGPGDRDHHVPGAIPLGEEPSDVVGRGGFDRVTLAGGLAAERMIGEQTGSEVAVHDVFGTVVVHRQLFEDHLALGLDVAVAQRRAAEHVAEHVEPERQVVARHAAVVRRVLLRRERVHVAADALDRGRDVVRRALVGALEEQMLEKVADTGQVGGLVAGADAHPRRPWPPSAPQGRTRWPRSTHCRVA